MPRSDKRSIQVFTDKQTSESNSGKLLKSLQFSLPDYRGDLDDDDDDDEDDDDDDDDGDDDE